jgi:hypothetical protein
LHGGGQPGINHVTGWETQPPQPSMVPNPTRLPHPPPISQVHGDNPAAPAPTTAEQSDQPKEKKKGFFGKIFGIFK